MRLRHYAYTPEAAGAATIAALQTLAGAGSLSLSGTYGATGFPSELAWTITLTSVNNLSGVNFTINYLSAQGNAFSVTTTGPNATTKTTTVIASRITSITTDAAAAAVSVGHLNVGYGPWKHLPNRVGFVSPSTVAVALAGTASVAIEGTYANIADNTLFSSGLFDWFTKVTSALPFQECVFANRETGTRLRIDSWTSGAIRIDLAVPAAG